jgi:hypothetical protein
VKQVSNYQARRSLGVYVNPSGKMNQQFQVLRAKSNNLAEKVLIQAMTRKEAEIMYHGFFFPAITYPLPVIHLSQGQCHAIETPFLKAILPRSGYNRSMSRAIRYAPKRYGGAGFHGMYLEQLVQNILMAFRHLRSPQHQPGQLLYIALTWTQAFAGVSWPIWTYPDRKTPNIPNPWIVAVRSALANLHARFSGLENSVPELQRNGDWFIMDKVLEDSQFDDDEIEHINAYRRYYQATTIADITDDRGSRLTEAAWTGTGDTHPDEFNVELFNQPRPDGQALRAWKKFLRTIANKDRILKQRLGEWIVPHTKCRKKPTWVYDKSNHKLYRRQESGQYREYTRSHNRYSRDEVDRIPVQPPASAYPVAVIDVGQTVMIRPHEAVSTCTEEQISLSFDHYIKTLQAWEYQLLANTRLGGTPREMVQMINEGPKLFIASDGSVTGETNASFGFVIHHVDTKLCLAAGNGPVPGFQPTSFRAEAYGALAACRLL